MKAKIITISYLIVLYFLAIANIVMKDQTLSLEERRSLKQFPEISIAKILDGSVAEEFEVYTLDQFPFRSEFRSLKARTEYFLFQKLDNHGIFLENHKIFKIEYPINQESIFNFNNKINSIVQNYLQGMKVYYAIIPDKNYYLENSKYLKMDYELLYQQVQEGLENLSYIELRDLLSINHYYDTDTHWRQEMLLPVADRLLFTMSGKSETMEFEKKMFAPFYGVYYGQAALGGKGEQLYYLTNTIIEQAYVENYEDIAFHEVYQENALGKMDSYNVFLSGSTPYITISNPQNTSGRELIIFRDSFGSSIAPLLLEGYSKIILVDLRYSNMDFLKTLISFDDQDVLFLYSTLIVNQSEVLKN